MQFEELPSKLLDKAVFEVSKLPGIGKRTALRLVLHLLKQEKEDVTLLANSLIELKENIQYCKVCKNISDTEVCSICGDASRQSELICVVENIRDVMSIENTRQYRGLYHVLGGVISPMDGVAPSDLTIDALENRIREHKVEELILALNTTMEGDTTNFYLYKKFYESDIKITTLSRGLSVGGELEFTDDVTLAKSLLNRTEFKPGG